MPVIEHPFSFRTLEHASFIVRQANGTLRQLCFQDEAPKGGAYLADMRNNSTMLRVELDGTAFDVDEDGDDLRDQAHMVGHTLTTFLWQGEPRHAEAAWADIAQA